MQALILRHWMCWFAKQGFVICFNSEDDKCKFSVGPPDLPQTAVSRQRRVLAGQDEIIQAADHDFNCDITPSVKLLMQPPDLDAAADPSTYYDGEVFVSLKDATPAALNSTSSCGRDHASSEAGWSG